VSGQLCAPTALSMGQLLTILIKQGDECPRASVREKSW